MKKSAIIFLIFISAPCLALDWDLYPDCTINFLDYATLAAGWQTIYDINDLAQLAGEWLQGEDWGEMPTANSQTFNEVQYDSNSITLSATDDGLPAWPARLKYIITSLPSGTLQDAGAGGNIIKAAPYTLTGHTGRVWYSDPNINITSFNWKASDYGTRGCGEGESETAVCDVNITAWLNDSLYFDGEGTISIPDGNYLDIGDSNAVVFWIKTRNPFEGILKKRHNAASGANIVTNGTFDTSIGWSEDGGWNNWSIHDGKTYSINSSSDTLRQTITFTANRTYRITYTLGITNDNSTSCKVYLGGSLISQDGVELSNGQSQIYTHDCLSGSDNSLIEFENVGAEISAITIDDVSVTAMRAGYELDLVSGRPKIRLYDANGTEVANIILPYRIDDGKWHEAAMAMLGTTIYVGSIDGWTDANYPAIAGLSFDNAEPVIIGATTKYRLRSEFDKLRFCTGMTGGPETLGNLLLTLSRTNTDTENWNEWRPSSVLFMCDEGAGTTITDSKAGHVGTFSDANNVLWQPPVRLFQDVSAQRYLRGQKQ